MQNENETTKNDEYRMRMRMTNATGISNRYMYANLDGWEAAGRFDSVKVHHTYPVYYVLLRYLSGGFTNVGVH